MAEATLAGKQILVTGATLGIGKATARALLGLGAKVGIVGRDAARTQAVADELRGQVAGAQVDAFVADLSLVRETRRLAAEVKARYARLDVLVNNAGAIFMQREETAEGLERTFALNHVSYFVLTGELLPLLEASGPARVVSVSSDAHRAGRVDFEDLQSTRGFAGMTVYGTSKLENILFTRELARRLAERKAPVTANSLHPGVIASGFGHNNRGFLGLLVKLGAPFLASPEKGARTSVFLASSPAVAQVSGKYFKDSREQTPTRAAQDDALARKLWDATEAIVASIGR